MLVNRGLIAVHLIISTHIKKLSPTRPHMYARMLTITDTTHAHKYTRTHAHTHTRTHAHTHTRTHVFYSLITSHSSFRRNTKFLVQLKYTTKQKIEMMIQLQLINNTIEYITTNWLYCSVPDLKGWGEDGKNGRMEWGRMEGWTKGRTDRERDR